MVKSIQISGKKLADLRIDVLFFSQEELGHAIGMSKGSVARLEQRGGGMLLSNFRKLAQVAKRDPETLRADIGMPDAPHPRRRIEVAEDVADALATAASREETTVPEMVKRMLSAYQEERDSLPRTGAAPRDLSRHHGGKLLKQAAKKRPNEQ